MGEVGQRHPLQPPLTRGALRPPPPPRPQCARSAAGRAGGRRSARNRRRILESRQVVDRTHIVLPQRLCAGKVERGVASQARDKISPRHCLAPAKQRGLGRDPATHGNLPWRGSEAGGIPYSFYGSGSASSFPRLCPENTSPGLCEVTVPPRGLSRPHTLKRSS